MFTGIIEEVGTIRGVEASAGDLRVSIAAQRVLEDIAVGDSIAVSGCCLTVVRFDHESFEVELSAETVAKTAPRWHEGQKVNLERAMQASSRFGGHIVSGHVEGVGEVLSVHAEAGAQVITIRAEQDIAKYLIPKGSITVDGVSLTLVDVGGAGGSSSQLRASDFTLWLIPHTLAVTTLGALQQGNQVNLEPDLIAKYLERLTLMREQKEESYVS